MTEVYWFLIGILWGFCIPMAYDIITGRDHEQT